MAIYFQLKFQLFLYLVVYNKNIVYTVFFKLHFDEYDFLQNNYEKLKIRMS